MNFLDNKNEPPHDKNNKLTCAPSKDSDQPGHPPSLIRVFAVCMKKAWVLSYPLSAQRRRWSDWADAQADLRLRWAHSHIVGFVMRRLKYLFYAEKVKFDYRAKMKIRAGGGALGKEGTLPSSNSLGQALWCRTAKKNYRLYVLMANKTAFFYEHGFEPHRHD